MKKIKLLYAEDEKNTRENSIRYIQSRYNFEIYVADDGAQALDLYKKYEPDILLTDITMPNMDGLELIKEVRKLSKQTQIIMLTAHSEQKKLLAAFDAYVVNYLIKPIDRQKLKKSIETALEALPKREQSSSSLVHIEEDATFDSSKGEYTMYGERVQLSKSEMLLLTLLCEKQHTDVDAYEIFMYVWDDFEREFSSNSVRTLVKKLRKKLPPDTLENRYGGYYRLITY